MKKELSWKLLVPLGLTFWLVGRFLISGIVGDSLNLLGSIVFIMGIINIFKKKKK